jgi:predicted metal-dependent phosphoesterase TrpH
MYVGEGAWVESPVAGIDLHTHSTASDGLVAPEQLVRLAADTGLRVVALTDHDTTAGMAAAARALPRGLTLVPGAEISCEVTVGSAGHRVSLHVLAYLFDPTEAAFADVRARLRESRVSRARRMVEKLAAAGHPVDWDRVRARADGTVGRPHVAAALAEAGLVAEAADAFGPAWIGAHGRYWVGKDQPDVWETLRLIKAAGGVSVFAHPFASRRGRIVGVDVIEAMARAGLTGIEVDHPDHPPQARARLRGIAADLGLVATGSSDFHGTDARRLGSGGTGPDAFDALLAGATGASPIHG